MEKQRQELIQECHDFIKSNGLYDKTKKVTPVHHVVLTREITEYDEDIVEAAVEMLAEWLYEMWKPVIHGQTAVDPNDPRLIHPGRIATRWEREASHRDKDREHWCKLRVKQSQRWRQRQLNKKREAGQANLEKLANQGIIEL